MIDIKNTTRSRTPHVPFEDMVHAALGKSYELSLVFIGDKRSRDLNFKHRGKNKPTNILSFPLSETDGELFINLKLARSQAANFKRSETNFIAYLFIHGLYHLKGYGHGSRMESKEAKLRAQFGV